MAKGDPGDTLEFNPVGAHLEIAISSVSTLNIPTGATKLLVQSVDKAARFTLDGTAPTSSKGFLLAADVEPLIIPLGNDTSIKFIEQEATSDLQAQWGEG